MLANLYFCCLVLCLLAVFLNTCRMKQDGGRVRMVNKLPMSLELQGPHPSPVPRTEINPKIQKLTLKCPTAISQKPYKLLSYKIFLRLSATWWFLYFLESGTARLKFFPGCPVRNNWGVTGHCTSTLWVCFWLSWMLLPMIQQQFSPAAPRSSD